MVNEVDLSCPVNWNHALNNSLVSWWKVLPNWRGGNIWRDLCGKNHGTPTNVNFGTVWSSLSPSGGAGSLLLDGSNDWIDIPDAQLGVSGAVVPAITVSAWVRPSTGYTSAYRRILAIHNGGNNYFILQLVSGSGDPRVYVDGQAAQTTGQGLTANVWTHLVATFDDVSNTGKVYKNGKLGSSGSITQQVLNYNYNIGHSQNAGDEYFPGNLDDIRLYRRALTDTEVWNLYQDSLAGSQGTLNYFRACDYVAPTNVSGVGSALADSTATAVGAKTASSVATALADSTATGVGLTVAAVTGTALAASTATGQAVREWADMSDGGGVVCSGSTAEVEQIVNCRRTFPLVYPHRSKFDQKARSRRPAYLASVTVCSQGLETRI